MRTRVRYLLVCIVVPLLSTVIASCESSRTRAKEVLPEQFRAGPGEQTLKEKYRLDIQLPMDEADFLDQLRKLNLQYEIFGAQTGVIPGARWSTTVNLSKAVKYYQIYGEENVREHTAEMYHAFVDDNGRVFYVENIFAYPIP